ncbi:MAG: AraC family transcriptional regulator [Capsulimonadaceae bacterium]|nr:AraC family transcriptional regulator [Capsulimonadaceae bacterium]
MDKTELFGDPRWRIALDRPPVIAGAGVAVMGTHGEERYLLPGLWCMHLYLYEVELYLDGVRHFIEPGCLSIVPPNVSLWYRYTKPGKHCYVHFREAAGAGAAGSRVVPVIRLDDRFEGIYTAMSSAVGAQENAPYRLVARAWELLCGVAEYAERDETPSAPSTYPSVRRAQELIELHLGGEICVEDLAMEVNVSKSYLAKLFRKACGETVAGYIFARRTARAFHMLANTTLPIKAIAYAVGMPDLQQFNKAIRRAYGRSPRSVRLLGGDA